MFAVMADSIARQVLATYVRVVYDLLGVVDNADQVGPVITAHCIVLVYVLSVGTVNRKL
jgi:hypothetical protein